MKSGLPPAAWAIRSRSSAETSSPISCVRLLRRRAVPAAACAGQPGRRSTSSGRAMHRSSSGAPVESSAVDSTRSRNVSSPHWMSSKTHDQRRLLLEQLAERPGDLVSARPDVRLAQQRSDRRRRDRIRRQRRELLHHLDDRPVGDPVAVGQTAPAHDARLHGGECLGDQPRLAHPGVADHRHQLAARLAPARAPTPRAISASSALAADEPRARGCAPARPAPRRAGTPAPAPPSLSASAARPARPTTASCTSACVASPISTSPGAAACSSRAATFTASPVASRSAVPVTTSPVLTPIRPLTPSSGSASRISTAARQARSASSSCADRHPEDRHHRVADELLHRPAVRLDDRLHPLEVARQQRPQRLGIRRLPQRGRADHVAEQHRHRLPHLALEPRVLESGAPCRSRRTGTPPGSPCRTQDRPPRRESDRLPRCGQHGGNQTHRDQPRRECLESEKLSCGGDSQLDRTRPRPQEGSLNPKVEGSIPSRPMTVRG